MKTKEAVTEEDFKRFLRWLDVDPDRAGNKYNFIHSRLVAWFTARSCVSPDELADEVIGRTVLKTKVLVERQNDDAVERTKTDERLPYFYAVANYVFKEYLRDSRRSRILPDPVNHSVQENEAEFECLDRCLAALSNDEKELIVGYYNAGNKTKGEHRRELAEKYGVTIIAIRIRAHRIKAVLRGCIERCLDKEIFSETN